MNDFGIRVVLTSDGSRTLYCDDAAECFHSESGAWSESKTVFLQNSGAATSLLDGKDVRILEIGFGTGLNFLLTADHALQHHASLQYVGLDLRLISADTFGELGYGVFLKNPSLESEFKECLSLASKNGTTARIQNVSLDVILQDAHSWATGVGTAVDHENQFDAVYMDAFSPDRCPSLWSESFLSNLFSALRPSGTLVTYCSKSAIQKRLRQLGFKVEALPGPVGGKRQVLRATK